MLMKNRLLFSVLLFGILMGALTSAKADITGLIGALTSNLGVTEEQASGGTGALFRFAKESLTPTDFQTVSEGLPGVDGLIEAAPPADAGSGMLGGVMGSVGNLGKLAGLIGPFAKLGMSSDMIGKFVPIILDYAKSTGGEAVMALLKGVFVGAG